MNEVPWASHKQGSLNFLLPLSLLLSTIHSCPFLPIYFPLPPPHFDALINWTTPFFTLFLPKNYIHSHPPHFHTYLWLSLHHKSLPHFQPTYYSIFQYPLPHAWPISSSCPSPAPSPLFPLFWTIYGLFFMHIVFHSMHTCMYIIFKVKYKTFHCFFEV